MNTMNVEKWMDNLGETHDNLVALGIVPTEPLKELYPGRDHLHINPELGIALSFQAETKQFESLFVTLIKTTPSTSKYEGQLPLPYMSKMNQSDVHAVFGDPMESRGPIKMPEPMGQTGGWESYPLDPLIYPGKKVVFQYTASMEVKTLVFTLIDKGHE
ncbi:DUF6392 family protein [Pseudomonas sp. MDT1-17]